MSGKVLYPDALICESEVLEDLEGMCGQGNLSKLQQVPSIAIEGAQERHRSRTANHQMLMFWKGDSGQIRPLPANSQL